MTSQKEAQKYLERLFLSTSLKMAKSREKFGLVVKQPFLFKAVKWEKYYKNCFSPQYEPHTAKLCFSAVLKHFRANSLKISLFSPKSDYLRKDQGNTQKVCFI